MKNETQNIDYCIFAFKRSGTKSVILAPHGGGIEPGTSEIAKEIAKNELSIYIFEGIKSRKNRDLHITSTNFDEPQCIKIVKDSDIVVAIHGERSDESVVYLGGLDKDLGNQLKIKLEETGFVVKYHQNSNLQGKSKSNICNRGRQGAGVQLELSEGIRNSFFQSLSAEGRKKPTPELKKFVTAIRYGLNVITD